MANFRPSEFDGRCLVFNPSEGRWQNYPTEVNQNLKLLIAHPTTPPNSEAVAMYLVPTDKHFPEKLLLVEDVASSSFRYKLSKEIFIQWTYRGDAFGFQCKSKEIAQQINIILEDIKTNVRLRPHKSDSNGDITSLKKQDGEVDAESLRSSYSNKSVHSLKDEQDEINQAQSDDRSGDEERPLQRINQFQPTTSAGKRRNSTKREDTTLKRSNSKSERSDENFSNPSLAKMMETLRQSSQRDKQQLNEKMDALQKQVGDVLKLLGEQNELLRELKNREQIIPAPSSFTAPPPPPQQKQQQSSPTMAAKAPTSLGAPPPPPPPPLAAPPAPAPPKISPTGGGGPPPPPPPPPAMKAPEARGKTLAEQLAEAKLKKESGSSNGQGSAVPAEPPKAMATIDFSTELQNRIKKRTGNQIVNYK